MPRRRSQRLFLSGGLACRLSARRRAGLAAGQGHQGADGIPITVRGGRYFIYRPPPGRERAV